MFDYEKNIEVGTWNLERALRQYGNKLHLALWKHNWGNNIDKIIEKYKTTAYKVICDKLRRVVKRGSKKHREPLNYVGAVLGHARNIMSLFDKLGVNYDISPFTEYFTDAESYPSTKPKRVSKKFVWTPYPTKPFDMGKLRKKKRGDAKEIYGITIKAHVVRKGETAYQIARRYNNKIKTLMRLNKINLNKIRPGMVIYARR
jgi:hypothetical protein